MSRFLPRNRWLLPAVAAAGLLPLLAMAHTVVCRPGGPGGCPLATGEAAKNPSDPVTVARVGTLGQPDPTAAYWKDAAPSRVILLPQTVTQPAIDKAEMREATVQAVSDGTTIAWRIAWSDAEADAVTDSGRFPDACAIQFPISAHANVMMGAGGGQVEILHWKAIWQRDVNQGFQDVRDLHPHAWTDMYWFAKGGIDAKLEEAFSDPKAKQWLIALSAGNPMSQWGRKQPCEECTAKGFGTLATQKDQATSATGIWAGGQWAVVLQRPLKTDDADDHQFGVGAPEFAIAIWQGSAGQVGGRKQFSGWVTYTLPGGAK